MMTALEPWTSLDSRKGCATILSGDCKKREPQRMNRKKPAARGRNLLERTGAGSEECDDMNQIEAEALEPVEGERIGPSRFVIKLAPAIAALAVLMLGIGVSILL